MIKIHDVVKDFLDKDVEAKNLAAKGFLNLSSYAKSIEQKVSDKAKKEVSVQSITVSLSRITKKLKAYKYLPEIKIKQISIKKPVVEMVYSNDIENINAISKISKILKEGDFFSVSTSTKDVAVIISRELKENTQKIFNKKPHVFKDGLVALSIRFDEKLTLEPGVGFSLMQKIAAKRVVLDEVVSTLNEFTLIFRDEYLSDILFALEDGKEK